MSSDVPEVREILRVLSPKIGSCQEALDAQAVGNALYGLQSMSSDVPEVREILGLLSLKIASFVDPLDLQSIANALYGLIAMRLDSSWKPILSNMFLNIEQSLSLSGQNIPITCSKDIRSLTQTLSIISVPKRDNKLRIALLSFNLLDDFNRFLSYVSALDSNPWMDHKSDPTATFRNRYERKYANFVMKLLKDRQNIEIYTNKYLFWFEADIIVRVLHTNGKESIINFEIDGIHHQRPVKRLFCKYRDEYLIRKHNVRIVRIS